MVRSLSLALLALLAIAAGPTAGWRGNLTGLYPDSKAPLEWSRTPKGLASELRASTLKPSPDAVKNAALVVDGLVRDWLILGPFSVENAVRDLEKETIPGEPTLDPAEGDKVGERTWKPYRVAVTELLLAFGEVDIPRIDLAKGFGEVKPNQVGYAVTRLYLAKGGKLRAHLEHGHGMRLWLNGKLLHNLKERAGTLGNFVSLSKHDLGQYEGASPAFDLDLTPGWNTLVAKVTSAPYADAREMTFALRISDAKEPPYDEKNIVWKAELPARSTSTPILVGDRIFLMAEPDELICLDRATGKKLWSAAINYWTALTPEERAKLPAALVRQIEGLERDIQGETDPLKRRTLYNRMQKALTTHDADRFGYKLDGHFESHFGIVGFTVPTPVSDGESVYVWVGNGLAASFDLAGKMRWIRRVDPEATLVYSSAPAISGGVFGVYQSILYGLDAKTGEILWKQPRVTKNNASIMPARIAGVDVFVSQQADVVRASDGKILWGSKTRREGDTGWSGPVILGDVVYQPHYGVNQLNLLDFTGATGDTWTAKSTTIESQVDHKRPDGKWLDRMTAASPLVHQGLAYLIDIYGTLYVLDLEKKAFVYRQDLDLGGLFHYNAVPVAASPVLIGDKIVVQNNQGTAIVFEPGRTYKEVRRNRIATQLDRPWPIPPQETLSYAPPIADATRLYLRGERYLYCIGTK
jgi:outer membrane protein assembly factor BamB